MPLGFVITAETYRTFIEETGIANALFKTVDVDIANSTALAEAEQRAQKHIFDMKWPNRQQVDVLVALDDLNHDPVVAAHSSATAEDLRHAPNSMTHRPRST